MQFIVDTSKGYGLSPLRLLNVLIQLDLLSTVIAFLNVSLELHTRKRHDSNKTRRCLNPKHSTKCSSFHALFTFRMYARSQEYEIKKNVLRPEY